MPEMEYRSDTLRTGAHHAAEASDSAGHAAAALHGAQPAAGPFGAVTGADAFAGAVGSAKAHHAVNAGTATHNMSAASTRASGTAALGDDNDAETTRLAPHPANAAAVSSGMDTAAP